MRKLSIFVISMMISLGLVMEGWAEVKRGVIEEEIMQLIAAMLTKSLLPVKAVAKEPASPVKKSDLPLELLATAIGNAKDPIAFIKDLQSEKQGTYKIGNKIQGATLVKIVRGEVTLERDGKQEILQLSQRARSWSSGASENPAIISANGNNIAVSKQGLLNEVPNVLSALPKVKISPYYEAEHVAGLMVDGIPKNSVIIAAGIRNKDVVKTVNNQNIDSYQKALQVFQKVKNQPEVKITLLREGKVQNINYLVRK
jgi:general secretion pathway protein C